MEDLIEKKEVQTIGEMLRNARTKQNKTLEEISEELCIRKYYLNAIENMDFNNIPPMPYGLGFIRSYADFLGLNSDRIVASYRQVMSGETETETNHEERRQEVSSPRLKHIVLGVLGLALLAVAWSVLPTTSKFEDTPEEVLTAVPEPVIVSEEEEKGALTADKEKSETLKDEEKAKPEVQTGAEKQLEKETEDKIKEDVKVKEAEKDTLKKSDKAVLPQMKIVLTGASWLELRQGKKVLLNGIYNKGFKYDIPSGKGLVITVGKPGSVQFLLNEKQIQVVTAAKRKNISLDSYFKTQD